MTNKEAIKILSNHFFSVGYSADGKIRNEKDEALLMAIKALEDSSHIIDALEKLKDESFDAIVKFGIEKSIECVRKIKEENT